MQEPFCLLCAQVARGRAEGWRVFSGLCLCACCDRLCAMGFSTVAAVASTAVSTAASVLPKVMEARGSYKQSDNLRRAADEQERLARRKAAAIEATAAANQSRGSRNALAELSRVRVDAAASNTVQEGSTYQRGVDMATRLQDEINAAANEQLERANSMRSQAAYDAWDLRNQANRSRVQGKAALVSGVGSLFSGVAAGLK